MRQKRRLGTMLLFLAVLLSAVSVLGKAPLLRLHFEGTKDGENAAGCLQGLETEIFQVADKNGTLTEDFRDSGIFLENLKQQRASAQKKAAAELEAFARRMQIQGKKKKTDEKGDIYLEQQPEGIYLIAPQYRFELSDGSFLYAPFLLTLPAEGVEEIAVKTEWEPDDGSDNSGNQNPGGNGNSGSSADTHGSSQKGNVKTGDETPFILFAASLWFSAVTIAILTARKLKKLKKK